jgi:hypothetical protein
MTWYFVKQGQLYTYQAVAYKELPAVRLFKPFGDWVLIKQNMLFTDLPRLPSTDTAVKAFV